MYLEAAGAAVFARELPALRSETGAGYSDQFPARRARWGAGAERARRGPEGGVAPTYLTGTSLIPENERKGSVSDIEARACVSRQNDGSGVQAAAEEIQI